MITAKKIVCKECGLEYELNEIVNRCRICYGSLDIVFDYDEIKKIISKESFIKERPTHWKYWMFYPVDSKKAVTLGEGGTQLLRSEKFGFENLFLKIETTNPTGSFKDRGSSVEITRAVEIKAKDVCCASTGNMGISIAAYSSRAGMKANVFLPRKVSTQKIKKINMLGARVFRVNGDYTKALEACEKFSKKTGAHIVGDYPFRGEGQKSVGFEIADQFEFSSPDYVVCPMGNGTLIYSVWDAFLDMKEVGLIDNLPAMVGIQASGCSPIVNAWKRGEDNISPIKKSRTIASAIDCPNPLDGIKALEAINKSNGIAEVVTDKELLKTRELLARKEGIIAELAGVASICGALKLKKDLEGKIVCIISGSNIEF
ncbi:MAG: threonine synthase [Candidatus Aenigmatarchaeota archaeon]